MSVRKIIHIDMDAFYASVEQRDNPEWRGKPLAVGYPQKRGVVAAASYEARKYGVRSVLPSTTAIRKCPNLIFAPPRFDVYRSVSQQIRQIFIEYTQLVEPLSLDEAYLDVTDNIKGIPTAYATAKEIRTRIQERTGLTASAGISYNKFLAKQASDQRKPNGQFAILPEEGAHFVANLPVKKFHGIGPVTAEKMNSLGIMTGADLREKSLDFLRSCFGKSGDWYYEISRGEDHRPVEPDRERKSSGSETTFGEDLLDPQRIEKGVCEMAQDVWRWCLQHNKFGKTITVKIKYSDFKQITRSRSLASPCSVWELLQETALNLTRTVYPLRAGVRLVGVTVSGFANCSQEIRLFQ